MKHGEEYLVTFYDSLDKQKACVWLFFELPLQPAAQSFLTFSIDPISTQLNAINIFD